MADTTGSLHNSIAKNTLLLYVRTFIIMIVGLFTARVVLEALGQVDFGVYDVVASVVGAMLFLNWSLSGGTTRFLTVALARGDRAVLEQTFSASLNLHIALAVLMAIVMETGGLWFLYHKLNIPASQMHAAFWVFQFSILSMMLTFTQVPYEAVLISHENMRVFAYLGMADAALRLIIAYSIKWVGGEVLVLYAFLTFAAYLLMQTSYRLYAKRHYPECRFRMVHDKKLYKKLLGYSGTDLIACVASISQTYGLNILMNIFFGPLVNTARALSLNIQKGVTSFVTGFTTASRPRVIKYAGVEDYEAMYTLAFRTGKIAYFLFLMVALPIAFDMRFVLTVWLGPNFPPETPLYSLIIIGTAMVTVFHSSYMMCFHGIGRIRTGSMVSAALSLITLPLAWVLFRCGAPSYWGLLLPLISAAMYHVAGWMIIHGYAYFPYSRILRTVYLPALGVTLLSVLLPGLVVQTVAPGWGRFLLVLASAECVMLPAAYYLGFTREERDTFVRPVALRFLRKLTGRRPHNA